MATFTRGQGQDSCCLQSITDQDINKHDTTKLPGKWQMANGNVDVMESNASLSHSSSYVEGLFAKLTN